MSARKSSHCTIFLIVSSGSPLALIASSLRSISKKPFCPMTRSLHPPMTACAHRVRFAGTWREEFFEAPIIGNTRLEACCKRHARYRSYSTVLPIRLTVVPSKAWRERLVRAETPNRIGKSTIADAIRYANDGGEHWAIVASLIETCKMNGFARLVWVLAPPPAPVQDDASTAPPANNPLKHTSCAR